jgi:hypothetical protein
MRVVVTDYHDRAHRPYESLLHGPVLDGRAVDEKLDPHHVLASLLAVAGARDGDEIEITVTRTGARPFGDRRVVNVDEGAYRREAGPSRYVRDRCRCPKCHKKVSVRSSGGLVAHLCPHRRVCVAAAALGPAGASKPCEKCLAGEAPTPRPRPPSVTEARLLRNLHAGRDPKTGVEGRSAHGGYHGTERSVVRHLWATRGADGLALTAAGAKAIGVKHREAPRC